MRPPSNTLYHKWGKSTLNLCNKMMSKFRVGPQRLNQMQLHLFLANKQKCLLKAVEIDSWLNSLRVTNMSKSEADCKRPYFCLVLKSSSVKWALANP